MQAAASGTTNDRGKTRGGVLELNDYNFLLQLAASTSTPPTAVRLSTKTQAALKQSPGFQQQALGKKREMDFRSDMEAQRYASAIAEQSKAAAIAVASAFDA